MDRTQILIAVDLDKLAAIPLGEFANRFFD